MTVLERRRSPMLRFPLTVALVVLATLLPAAVPCALAAPTDAGLVDDATRRVEGDAALVDRDAGAQLGTGALPPTPTGAGAPDAACTDGNLLRGVRVTGTETTGPPTRIRDGHLALEGAGWNAAQAVVLEGKAARLQVDLGRVRAISGLVLQGDNNDVYAISGSVDGKTYTPLWRAHPMPEPGLRTRQAKLPKPAHARYLRVRGVGGDSHYSVSELQAFCKLPKPWPVALKQPPHHTGWKMLTNPMMVWLKAWLALAALVVALALSFPFPRRVPLPLGRAAPWALLGLSAAGAGAVVAMRLAWIPLWWRWQFTATLVGAIVLAALGLLSSRWLFPATPPRHRPLLQLPLFLAGIGALVAWWWLGERLWLQVGLAVLSVWFVLRWRNGAHATAAGLPQRAAEWLAARRWVTALYVLLVLAGTGGAYAYVDAHPKLPPRAVPHMAAILWAGGTFAALLFLGRVARWLRRPPSFERAAHGMLAVMGLLALSAWWNVGHFHFNHYIHIHEHYHYLLGAKYGEELRFTRLYDCTTVADHQDHLGKRVTERKVRSLGTDNDMVTTAEMIAHPERCTDHFSKERWQDFRRDLRFLRGRFSKDRWDRSQTDHGYNATPVWAVAGRLITEAVGQLDWAKLYYLGALDSALLMLMWGVVWWAFGWQATCVALVFWGCNFPARYYWNGGGFLRYDYLMWLFVGISLLKRQRMFGAGMALTYATGLRIFPGFVVAALVLKALARMLRERRFVLSRAHTFFAAGCIAMILVLVPASDWAMGGLDAWQEFATNSDKHLKTALTNNMGLKTALGWDWDSRAKFLRSDKHLDPFKDWKSARAYFYAKRAPIHYALIFLFCIILARAGEREEDWVAACLGTGLIVVAAELTCYYYCFFAAYGLLWHRRRAPAVLVLAYSATTSALYQAMGWNDDHFAAMSLVSFVFVVGVTAHAAFGRRLPPESDARAAARTGA